MLRQSVTDQEIKNWVLQQYGLRVEAGWIADCKQECGIPVRRARLSGRPASPLARRENVPPLNKPSATSECFHRTPSKALVPIRSSQLGRAGLDKLPATIAGARIARRHA